MNKRLFRTVLWIVGRFSPKKRVISVPAWETFPKTGRFQLPAGRSGDGLDLRESPAHPGRLNMSGLVPA